MISSRKRRKITNETQTNDRVTHIKTKGNKKNKDAHIYPNFNPRNQSPDEARRSPYLAAQMYQGTTHAKRKWEGLSKAFPFFVERRSNLTLTMPQPPLTLKWR